jgi:hypothetical protein
MAPAAKAAELALVAATEAAHAPDTVTEVVLTSAPHGPFLNAELLALPGVTRISVSRPPVFPGTVVIRHNALTANEQTSLTAAALAHDASAVPALSVDGADPRVFDPGSLGTVVVSDSRGAAAKGKTVRIRIPPGGSAGIDGDSYTLNAAGQAALTFQGGTGFTGELTFEAYYASGEADSVIFTVRRGTA